VTILCDKATVLFEAKKILQVSNNTNMKMKYQNMDQQSCNVEVEWHSAICNRIKIYSVFKTLNRSHSPLP
jgi:hypothetical protein